MLLFNKTLLRSNQLLFAQFQQLMETAFPLNERRNPGDFALQLEEKDFHIEAFISEDQELLGFITWWELTDFCYVEHFAVAEGYRNKGWGEILFGQFQKTQSKPIIAEVEPPTDLLSQRRIRFYERQGMAVLPYAYQQPPYHKGFPFLEMLIISQTKEMDFAAFTLVKNEIYAKVYKCFV